VLDEASAAALAREQPSITLPDEDVSHQLVERFFARCEVSYETAFLRWDKTRTVQLLAPRPARRVDAADAIADLVGPAEEAAAESLDWWRQVGAAMRLPSGEVVVAHNVHQPHPLSPYAAGDPRANFFKGVHIELTTAFHAEAQLIAAAARRGAPTAGAVLYVTDFPCPPCARLIAAAGVATVYFRAGYAVLDGQDVLERANVELVQVG
jgi:dCMP deaminase